MSTLADLDGVLLGGGHWLAGADGARLSVVVSDAWRVAALSDAFEQLGVADSDPPPVTDLLVARTAMTGRLRPLEQRWRRGANETPPEDLRLTAAGLRLWAITSGTPDDVGFLLRTPAGEAMIHRAAGAVLARTGVAAVELGARGGPGWRISSARRLRRLAELVGAPPPGGEGQWPRLTR